VDVLRQALDQVRACLPASWALEVRKEVRRGGANVVSPVEVDWEALA
jgi:hypothetical protein